MDSLIAHIGIAVKSIEKSLEQYRLLTGVEPSEIHTLADQKVKVAFFASPSKSEAGFPRIELVAPDDPDSPISKFLEKKGEGLHHICILVDDIVKRLEELSKSGARLIDKEPRLGAEGDLIAFVHPESTGGVLIELQERKKSG